MIKASIKYILSVCLVFITSSGFTASMSTQNCSGFEKKCESAPSYFTKSSLSRSITLRKARKVVINQTFLGGREYYISICGRKKIGDLHLRLIADDENQMVLFDNAANNFKTTQLFVIQNTMKVKIELSAPHYFDDIHAECAGIQIHYHQKK